MVVKWIASVSLAVLAAQAALVTAQEAPVQTVAAAVPEFRADEGADAAARSSARSTRTCRTSRSKSSI